MFLVGGDCRSRYCAAASCHRALERGVGWGDGLHAAGRRQPVLGFIIGAVVLAGVKAVSSLRGAGK